MRPREIFAFSEDDLSSNDEAAIDAALMSTDRHIDLVQDITTDCSVVASLSAAVEILTGKHSVGRLGIPDARHGHVDLTYLFRFCLPLYTHSIT